MGAPCQLRTSDLLHLPRATPTFGFHEGREVGLAGYQNSINSIAPWYALLVRLAFSLLLLPTISLQPENIQPKNTNKLETGQGRTGTNVVEVG